MNADSVVLECALEGLVFPTAPPDCSGSEQRFTIQITGVGSATSSTTPLLHATSYFCEGVDSSSSTRFSVTNLMEAVEESPLVVSFVQEVPSKRIPEEVDRIVTFAQSDADLLITEISGPTFGWAFLCDDRKELQAPLTVGTRNNLFPLGSCANRRLLVLHNGEPEGSAGVVDMQAHIIVSGENGGSRLFSSNPFTVDSHEINVVEKVLGFKLYTCGLDGDGPTLSLTISVPSVAKLPSGVQYVGTGAASSTNLKASPSLQLKDVDVPLYAACLQSLHVRMEDFLDAFSPAAVPHVSQVVDEQLLMRAPAMPTVSYPTGGDGTGAVHIYSGSSSFVASSGSDSLGGVRELRTFTKLRKRFGMTCYGARLHSMLLWYNVVYVLQANTSKYFAAPHLRENPAPNAVSAAASTTTLVRLLLPPTVSGDTDLKGVLGGRRASGATEDELLLFLRRCASGTSPHSGSVGPGITLSSFQARTKELTELLLDLWEDVESLLLARLASVFGPEPFQLQVCASPAAGQPQLISRDWMLWGSLVAALQQSVEFPDAWSETVPSLQTKLEALRDVLALSLERPLLQFSMLMRHVGPRGARALKTAAPSAVDALFWKAKEYVAQERSRTEELKNTSWWVSGAIPSTATIANPADYDLTNEFGIPKVLQLRHEMSLLMDGPQYQEKEEARRAELAHARKDRLERLLNDEGVSSADLLTNHASNEFDQFCRSSQNRLAAALRQLQPHHPVVAGSSGRYPTKVALVDSSLSVSRSVLRRVFQPNPLLLGSRQRHERTEASSYLGRLLSDREGQERAALQLVFTDAFAAVAEVCLPLEATLTLTLLKLLNKKALAAARESAAVGPGGELWADINTNIGTLKAAKELEAEALRRREAILAAVGGEGLLPREDASTAHSLNKFDLLQVHARELEEKHRQRQGQRPAEIRRFPFPSDPDKVSHTSSKRDSVAALGNASMPQSTAKQVGSLTIEEEASLSTGTSIIAAPSTIPQDTTSPYYHLSHGLLINQSTVLIPLEAAAQSSRWEGEIYGYFLHRKWLQEHKRRAGSTAILTPFPLLLKGFEVGPGAAENRFRASVIKAFEAAKATATRPAATSRRSEAAEEVSVHRFVVVVPQASAIDVTARNADVEASVIRCVQKSLYQHLDESAHPEDIRRDGDGWHYRIHPECAWQLSSDAHFVKRAIFAPFAGSAVPLGEGVLYVPTRCPPTVGSMVPTAKMRVNDACSIHPADFHFLQGYEQTVIPVASDNRPPTLPSGAVVVYGGGGVSGGDGSIQRALVLVIDAIVPPGSNGGCLSTLYRGLAAFADGSDPTAQSVLLKAVFTAEVGAAIQLVSSSPDIVQHSLSHLSPTLELSFSQGLSLVEIPRGLVLNTHTASRSEDTLKGHEYDVTTPVSGDASSLSHATPVPSRENSVMSKAFKAMPSPVNGPNKGTSPRRACHAPSVAHSDAASTLSKNSLSMTQRKKLGRLASLFQFMDDADQFVDDGESEEDILVEVQGDGTDDNPYLRNLTPQSGAKRNHLRRSTLGSRFADPPDGAPPDEDPVHPTGVRRQLRELEASLANQNDTTAKSPASRRSNSISSVHMGRSGTANHAKSSTGDRSKTPTTPRSQSRLTNGVPLTATTTVVRKVHGVERFRKDPYAGVVLQRRAKGLDPHPTRLGESIVEEVTPTRSKQVTRRDVLVASDEASQNRSASRASTRSIATAGTGASHVSRNPAFPVRVSAILGRSNGGADEDLPITYQEERMLVRAAFHNKGNKLLSQPPPIRDHVSFDDGGSLDGYSSEIPPSSAASRPVHSTHAYGVLGADIDAGAVDDGDDEDYPLWLRDGGSAPVMHPVANPHSTPLRSTTVTQRSSKFTKAANDILGLEEGDAYRGGDRAPPVHDSPEESFLPEEYLASPESHVYVGLLHNRQPPPTKLPLPSSIRGYDGRPQAPNGGLSDLGARLFGEPLENDKGATNAFDALDILVAEEPTGHGVGNASSSTKYVVGVPGDDDEVDEHGVPYSMYNEMGRSPSSVAAGYVQQSYHRAGSPKKGNSVVQFHPQDENPFVGRRPAGRNDSATNVRPVGMNVVLEPIDTSTGPRLDSFGAVIDRSVAARSEERAHEERGLTVDDLFAQDGYETDESAPPLPRTSKLQDDLVHWANPRSATLHSSLRPLLPTRNSPNPRSSSAIIPLQHRSASPSHSVAPSDIFASATVIRQQQLFGEPQQQHQHHGMQLGWGAEAPPPPPAPLKLSLPTKEEIAAFHKVLTGWELMHDHNAHKAITMWTEVASKHAESRGGNNDGSWAEVNRSKPRGAAFGLGLSSTTGRPVPASLVAMEATALLLEHHEVDMNAAVHCYSRYVVEVFDVLLTFAKALLDEGAIDLQEKDFTSCVRLVKELRAEMKAAEVTSDEVPMIIEMDRASLDAATPDQDARVKQHLILTRQRYPPRTFVALVDRLWSASPELFSKLLNAGLAVGTRGVPYPTALSDSDTPASSHHQELRYLALMLQQGIARAFFNVANLMEREYQDLPRAYRGFEEAHRFGEVIRTPERMVMIQRRAMQKLHH